MAEEEKGIVYVLTNEAMPGLVKIGYTKRKDIKRRMKELYGTGVPLPFVCHYACQIPIDRCEFIEKKIHSAFAPNRLNPDREFFQILPSQVVSIFEILGPDGKDVTEEVSKDINKQLTAGEKEALNNATDKKKKRPSLNYELMGIPVGAVLTFNDNPSITVKVQSAKKVEYNDEITSLTSVTKKLMHLTSTIQPTPKWSYNGKSLSEIYNETFTPSDEE